MSTVTAVPLLPVKRGYLIWLWIGIALAVFAAAALAWAGDTGIKATPSGLKYQVLAPGDGGPHPAATDVTLVNYVGRLTDGKVFDQSQRPTPMPVAGVVPGFAEALKLMVKGARYRFWIPPQLGYKDKAEGPIPPNSTLVFDVELVDFISSEALQRLQMQQMMRGGAGAGAPGAGAPGAGVMPGAPMPGVVPGGR